MADRLSSAQLERLGKRLIATEPPAEADLALLRGLLLSRSEQLERSIARVQDALGLSPSSRVKNTGTILEKLRRHGGWTLGGMQDLAGMRVVGDFDRNGQDVVVGRLRALFASEARAPKVIDRRAEPMHGYRAVHVVVFPEGHPIEIQVRTTRQHEWAEVFEKLADLVGRGIRYGEPPERWENRQGLEGAPELLARYAEVSDVLRASKVRAALILADWIAALEEGESSAPGSPELLHHSNRVDAALAEFKASLTDDL